MGLPLGSVESLWNELPSCLVLNFFRYLSFRDIVHCSAVCRNWYVLSKDELLWMHVFKNYYNLDYSTSLLKGKSSWYEEFYRLYMHSPCIAVETLKQHSDQVLHVIFSHNGKMFSTCSKDGFVRVWNATSPSTEKYSQDMKNFTWQNTQYSQFNPSDTLLLVSGVHFGPQSNSGEIAIFNLEDKFTIQARVLNKPYDVFGTWISDSYLLSGNLHWLGQYFSCSAIWLNKSSQVASDDEAVVLRLFKFANLNASSIRRILIAENSLIKDSVEEDQNEKFDQFSSQPDYSERESDTSCSFFSSSSSNNLVKCASSLKEENLNTCPNTNFGKSRSRMKSPYRHSEVEKIELQTYQLTSSDTSSHHFDDISMTGINIESAGSGNDKGHLSGYSSDCEGGESFQDVWDTVVQRKSKNSQQAEFACREPKYLIFATGNRTFTPHQIGIKRIEPELTNVCSGSVPVRDELNTFDPIDHTIEIAGHIVGLGLSPNNRYLYVNVRAWIPPLHFNDPLVPPNISQNILMHVFDLATFQEVGPPLSGHRAFTPSIECFFIFLDVAKDFVASGSENKLAYVWERNYRCVVATLPHQDVVNAVAFNPRNSEHLVTVSDDNTVKVWRTRNWLKRSKSCNKRYQRFSHCCSDSEKYSE